MVVRRFNYYRFFVFVVVLSVIIFTTYKLISNYKYKQTYEYKLSLVGYKEDEITTIKNKLSDSEIDKLLELKYDKNIVKLMNEKYFIYKNLSKYLDYKKENKLESYKNIITKINTESKNNCFYNYK